MRQRNKWLQEQAQGQAQGQGEHAPGTVRIVAGRQQDEGIVLVPKPSSNPDDPLNWTRARKLVNVALIFFYTFATGVGGTSVYSVLEPISQDTGLTLGQLNSGTGYLFLLAGWSNLLWQPLALTFGRRPVYLLSILGCAGMSEWAAHISSYPQWAACRCLYGFWTAPVEVLPELCIAEVFFAHERGAFVGLYMLVLACSNFIAPLIAGFINNTYGWRWVQHWAALLLLLNFLLALLFYEDSMFNRGTPETQSQGHEYVDESDSQVILLTQWQQERPLRGRPKPFWKRMALFRRKNPKVTLRTFVLMALRPVYMFFALPLIAWCGTFYGWALAWYNVYNATASSILSEPPYNFSSAIVGTTYVAPLIGALVGGIYAGPISDWVVLQIARRNGGVREPEHRLIGLAAYCVIMPAGIFLWGIGAAHHIAWIGLLFGAAMVGACNVIGGAYSIAYSVDCYKDISGESLVSVILARNTISFAFNYAITPWIDHSGLQNTFIVVGVLALVTGLSTVAVIYKGRRLRLASKNRYWRLANFDMY
uniref:ARAD1C17094p n=1 Tax=Blastobotrys adeninivorans TaxID=409370 RepID=A0A060T1K0_BLAAD